MTDREEYVSREEEKARIMRLVQEGKITAEDAERLLEVLDDVTLKEKTKEEQRDSSAEPEQPAREKIPNVRGKILVEVWEKGKKVVNVVFPIGILKIMSGIPFSTNGFAFASKPGENINLREMLKKASESGLDIDKGIYVRVVDEKVTIYDVNGVAFVNVDKN